MSFQSFPPNSKPDYLTSSDPAANAEASITVPSGSPRFLILSASIALVQGATQTPLGYLVVKNELGTVLGQFAGASAATSASITTQYNWYPTAALTAGAGATVNTAPIPYGLVLKGGWTVSTSTTGKGANTDYGPLTLWVVSF